MVLATNLQLARKAESSLAQTQQYLSDGDKIILEHPHVQGIHFTSSLFPRRRQARPALPGVNTHGDIWKLARPVVGHESRVTNIFLLQNG